MRSYFSLQWKRVMRVFPFALVVTVVLFVGIVTALSCLIAISDDSDKNVKLRIGYTGDTDNDILRMAVAAFQNFDESRYTIEFMELDEPEAEKRLKEGSISAYLIVPDDFVDKAMRGEMEPLYYVTSAGSTDIVAMFKNEVTSLVTDVVVSSQKGTFGLEEALSDNGVKTGTLVDDLALEYVSGIMKRAEILTINDLGIDDGVRLSEMYLCSLTVLFLMLLGLPFVAVYARRDRSLQVLLYARGTSHTRQVFYEWLPHFLSMVCLMAAVFVPMLAWSALGRELLLPTTEWVRYALLALPVLAMCSAFNLFIFELGGNAVSATLLHFFISLCTCYVSGAFYPVYTFPEAVQAVERFLPTGLARETLILSMSSGEGVYPILGVMGYAVLFFAATCWARLYRVRRWEGT